MLQILCEGVKLRSQVVKVTVCVMMIRGISDCVAFDPKQSLAWKVADGN